MKVGRKKAIDKSVLRVLEEAFSVGATDKEACFLADIGESTLYDYCKANPEFSERKEALKKMPNFTAKKLIVSCIEDGDKAQANWWLERKGKDEGFNSRTEITGADGKELNIKLIQYGADDSV